MAKYFTLKEVPKKNISNGLIALFNKDTKEYTNVAYTNINKGQTRYLLPESKGRKVIGIYQQIKRYK